MASFRLLQLPESAQLEVLRSIERFELILFSFLSNKAKKMVNSIKIKSNTSAYISVGQDITIRSTLDFGNWFEFEFYGNHVQERDLRLVHPGTVRITRVYNDGMRQERCSLECTRIKYQMRDWINHILSVTNVREIDVYIRERTRFNCDSLFETLKESTIGEMQFYDPAFLKYAHRSRKISMRHILQNTHDIQKVLIQNLDFLSLKIVKITLNDLLMINCVCFEVTHCKNHFKDLNRFLKLWKRGSVTNKRIEHLSLDYIDDDNNHRNNPPIDEVLEGINHKVMGQEVKRKFMRLAIDEMDVQGGYDIINVFGRRITLVFDTEEFFIDIFFWPA